MLKANILPVDIQLQCLHWPDFKNLNRVHLLLKTTAGHSGKGVWLVQS